MIEEVLMARGGFDLSFLPDTPQVIKEAARRGSVIYVTAADGAYADVAMVRAQAVWAGKVTGHNYLRGTFRGASLVGFLASQKGQAAYIPNYAPLPALPFTMAQFVATMFAGGDLSNGVWPGTGHAPQSTPVTEYDYEDRPGLKDALDYVAETTGNEWRITPQGVIDYGTIDTGGPYPIRFLDETAHLFAARTILITPEGGAAQAGDWHIVEPVGWDPDGDIDDYRNQTVVLKQDRTAVRFKAATVGEGFARLDGGGPALYNNTKQIVSPSSTNSDVDNLAQVGANFYAAAAVDFDCSIDLDQPAPLWFVPGDSLFVWDADAGLVGTEHVPIPGLVAMPLEQRIFGFSWPVREGYGVYAVDKDDRTVVVDLTPHIQFEAGPTKLTLGSLPKPAYVTYVESLIE